MDEQPLLKVYTLGRLTMEQNGTPLTDFVSQKAPVLFTYLLCHPREHPRDVLAETFWSDTTGDQALKNLRTVLSSLQKSLGDYLDVTRQTLAIANIENIWLDAQAFDKQLDMINQRQQRPYSPRRLMADLEEALALYQGDFLVGVRTNNAPELDTWVTLEQERLRGRAANAMFQLVELSLASGAYQQGIEYGRKLLTLEPLWEQAQRAQMLLLAESGNRTAAVQVYDAFAKLLKKELDVEPEDETKALYRDIKTGRLQPSSEPRQRPHNLHQPLTPYIETPMVVEQLNHLLDDADCRLLTLLGQGGIGKTRLSQHIALQRLEDYSDGVFFVPLASLTVLELVPHAILNALGFDYHDTRQSPQEMVLTYLRDKHLLLILDNFEQVMDATELVKAIIGRAPYVQIIVTSREQLHLQGEHVFSLHVLAYPESEKDDADFEAVRLFAAMAKRVNPDFDADEQQDAIGRICKLVDGLPLAIVIAAAWAQFLPPTTIAERIQASLEFLTTEQRDLPERHRGILALLRTTWESLSEHERTTMMKLSVFPGDFDEAAATAITEATLADLRGLVSKSLLQADGQGRYLLHELLRRFASEQAQAAQVVRETYQAHHAYYQQWLNEQEAQNLPIHVLYRLIDREYHNITFLDWLSPEEYHRTLLDYAPILTDYWIMRGYSLAHGSKLLGDALPYAATPQQKAHGSYRMGQVLVRLQQLESAQPLLDEGLALSREIGDVLLEAKILNEMYRLLGARGDYASARLHLLEMVEVVEQDEERGETQFQQILSMAYSNLGIVHMQMNDSVDAENYTRMALNLKDEATDPVGKALCHNTLGVIALKREDYGEAQTQFEEGLRIARLVGHTRHQTIFSGNLAEVFHKQGQHERAYQMYRDTLQVAYQIDNHKTCLNVLEQLTDITLDLNQPKRAARLFGAAQHLREVTKLAVEPRQLPEVERREGRLRDALSTDELASQLAEGQAMSLKEAVAYVKSSKF